MQDETDRLLERITIDPDICNGKPTIRGMRITVETVLGFLTAGDSEADILHQYPSLEKDDIRACLAAATRAMSNEHHVRRIA